MSMYQHPAYIETAEERRERLLGLARRVWKKTVNEGSLMNERRPLDLRDGSTDLNGLYLVEESSKYGVKILGDEILPNGFTAKGKPCLFENGVPVHVSANLKSMLSALAAMERV